MGVLFSPKRFFDELAKTIQLAPLLVALRWVGTASFITLPLWLMDITPFSPPLLPIPLQTYYFWQLVFVLPYGVVLTLLLSTISLLGLRSAGRLGTRFYAVFAVISYGLFLPWLGVLFWDMLLIFIGRWELVWAAPVHSLAVVAEGFLFAYGFRRVFGASWSKAAFLAVIDCLVFVGLSAMIMR